MKNQDPLDRDDPTDFTAQLVQFSSLELLFNLNGAVEDIASSFESRSHLAALGTLGIIVAFTDDTSIATEKHPHWAISLTTM